jgi:hypothetical protein
MLEKEQQIEQQKTSKFTLITVLNYEQYQKNEQDLEQQSNNKVTTKEQQSNTIKRNKDINNITNVILEPPKFGNPEINELIEFWNTTTSFPINSQVQKNRNACSTLLKQHGAEKVKKLINGVVLSHEDKYAPKITNFVELQANQNKLLLWGKQQTNTRKVVKI